MTEADECVVAVGITIADTSEEAHELIVVHITAHISVMILIGQERTIVQVVPEESCGREVGVRGAEAVVLIIEIAVTHEGIETVIAPLCIVARGQFKVLVDIGTLALTGRTVIALTDNRILLRRGPRLTSISTLTPRDHQVGLPSLNRLNGHVTNQLREAATGVTKVFVQQ